MKENKEIAKLGQDKSYRFGDPGILMNKQAFSAITEPMRLRLFNTTRVEITEIMRLVDEGTYSPDFADHLIESYMGDLVLEHSYPLNFVIVGVSSN